MPMPAPGGAPPTGGHPGMGPPPTGTGPASAPGGMPGNHMAGMEKVKGGVQMLIAALPMLPLGSEIQTIIMKAVQDIGKHATETMAGGDPQAMVQMLANMGRQVKAQPQAGALQQMMGGGSPPPGGGPPPPGAGAPPPPPPMPGG